AGLFGVRRGRRFLLGGRKRKKAASAPNAPRTASRPLGGFSSPPTRRAIDRGRSQHPHDRGKPRPERGRAGENDPDRPTAAVAAPPSAPGPERPPPLATGATRRRAPGTVRVAFLRHRERQPPPDTDLQGAPLSAPEAVSGLCHPSLRDHLPGSGAA